MMNMYNLEVCVCVHAYMRVCMCVCVCVCVCACVLRCNIVGKHSFLRTSLSHSCLTLGREVPG